MSDAQKTMGNVAAPRVFCRKCGRLTCGRRCCDPVLFGCIPLGARLENQEGSKTRYDDAIQDAKDAGVVLL